MKNDLKKLVERSEQLDKIIDDEIAKEEKRVTAFLKLMSQEIDVSKELKEKEKVNKKIKKILLDCYKKHNP